MGTFDGINTALRGIQAQQASLDVTAHNISNVETPGYSRQRAILGAAPALTIPAGGKQDGTGSQVGQGVDVLSYQRLRDDFLDLQYRAQNMTSGQADTAAQRLGVVQDQLGDGTANDLGAQLDNYWSSWQTLASNPQSSDAKAAVVGAAQGLASRFASMDSDLAAAGAQATAGVDAMLGDQGPIKPIADELATLNAQINNAQGSGQQPNDLMDRRDQLLDQLSNYGQVSVTPDPTLDASGNPAYPGMIQVSFGGAATPLVSQSTVTMPTTATLSATPGGQIGGLQDVATKVAGYRATLNNLAAAVISATNSTSSTPVFTGTGASDIGVVATAATISAGAAGGASGDNSVAMAMSAQRGGAIDTGYSGLVGTIGGDVAQAQNASSTSSSVLNSLEARRQSVSGVSMDEEMADLVRFQRGYQAAARALSTMDDVLNTLINSTGGGL
jgi:flagellar hook-associated protein 1 FlgK